MMQGFITLLLTVTVGLLAGCGEQDTTTVKRTQSPAGSSDAKNGGKNGPNAGDDTGADVEGTGDDDSAAGGGETGGGTGDGSGELTGLDFFEDTVLPVFQAQCVSCHTDPGMPSAMPAPFTIYSYNLMKAKLAGISPKDNALINKMMNKTTHSGGDRCTGNPAASPCKEVAQWWEVEFGTGDDGGAAANGLTGRIFEVTPLGKIIGWAYDADDTARQLSVVFYIDGPSGTGTKVGPTVANRGGADNNTPGDHAFLFDVPVEFRDKKKHTIRAYAVVDGVETALGSEPYEFTAYALSEAGRNFYNQNVAGQVAACSGCHVVSYEQHFYALVAPAPSAGGTATNNVLINKAGTRNGTTHGGGNRCGAGQPCNVFQQWWQIEFGNN